MLIVTQKGTHYSETDTQLSKCLCFDALPNK